MTERIQCGLRLGEPLLIGTTVLSNPRRTMDCIPRDEWERRIDDFTRLVADRPHLQFAVRQTRSLSDLLAVSRRIGAPLKALDVALNYRDMNETWWPWFDMPMQVRQHFVHVGEMPQGDAIADGSS